MLEVICGWFYGLGSRRVPSALNASNTFQSSQCFNSHKTLQKKLQRTSITRPRNHFERFIHGNQRQQWCSFGLWDEQLRVLHSWLISARAKYTSACKLCDALCGRCILSLVLSSTARQQALLLCAKTCPCFYVRRCLLSLRGAPCFNSCPNVLPCSTCAAEEGPRAPQ